MIRNDRSPLDIRKMVRQDSKHGHLMVVDQVTSGIRHWRRDCATPAP